MQIDLKKFIESMYKYGQHNLSYSNAIPYALADQGYKIDDEHHVVSVEEIKGNNGGISHKYELGEDIVHIAEVNEPQLPYVAIKDFSDPKYDNKTLHLPVFCKDEIVTKEKVFKMIPYMTEELFNECFRPNVPEQRRMELYAGGKISGQIGGQKPKFKVGDWVVRNGEALQISDIDTVLDGTFHYWFTKGTWLSSKKMENAMLWTINDAKDGDVLYLQKDGKEHIIIYKGVIKERFRTFVSAYCAYNGIVDAFCFADVSRYVDIAYGGIMPATKEQLDLLFAKMHEAGYEWDAEKKELKKIEQKPVENKGMNLVEEEMTPFQKKVFCIVDTAIEEEQGLSNICNELLALAKQEIEQKQEEPASVWHDANERPQKIGVKTAWITNDKVFYSGWYNKSAFGHEDMRDSITKFEFDKIRKWCYLDDLLNTD